jgi:hypothetical protein
MPRLPTAFATAVVLAAAALLLLPSGPLGPSLSLGARPARAWLWPALREGAGLRHGQEPPWRRQERPLDEADGDADDADEGEAASGPVQAWPGDPDVVR